MNHQKKIEPNNRMKSKPVLVRHWNKVGNTTVLIELYKEGTVAHKFRSRADNDHPKNQKYEPRVSLHWYRMVPVYQD
jgi:hypothetical protein